MGKRKKSSRKPMGPKKREALQTTGFKCPFCNHESSVTVAVDKKNYIGTVDCRNCTQHYQSSSDMRALMHPVDVYYEWIDACEVVAKQDAAATAAEPPSATRTRQTAAAAAASRAGLAPGEKYTEEDRGFIDDADDVDAEAEYDDK